LNKSGNDTRGVHGDAHPGPARPLPWVTAGLLAATLLATLAGPPARELEGPRSALRAAALLWSRHAFLSPEPEVLIEAGRGLSASARRERFSSMRELAHASAPDAEERARLQEELDALTAQALDGSERRAWTAWVPAHPHLAGFLSHPFFQRDLLAWLAVLPILGILGVSLELALGWRMLLGAVALGWLGPPLFLLVMLPGSEVALRGSSALSATLLGVAALRFWRSGAAVPSPVWEAGALGLRSVVLPLRGLAFAYLVEQLLCVARVGLGEHPYQASLGGLALGAAAALLAQRQLEPVRAELPAAPAEADGASLLEQARKARARGENGLALGLLRQAVRDHPDDADVVVELWEAARACGRQDVGIPRMLALVQRGVARGELSPAARHWLRLREADPRVQLPPESAIPLAFALARLREGKAALETLRSAFEDPGARISGALALQAVEIAGALEDEALVQQAARAGLALPYLSPEIRQRLEAFAGKSEGTAAAPVPPAPSPRPRSPEPQPEPPPLPAPAPAGAAEAREEPATPAPDGAPTPTAPSRRIAVLEGTPDRLAERGLSMQLAERTLELAYERIQAIAVAGIAGENGADPLVVIDLVLNWSSPAAEPLHVVRIRSDRFDPRLLVGDALGPAEASRVFLHELHVNTRAVPLPDAASAEARPLHLYATLADYEREVLRVAR
jgi:hypothetical protein